jgi:hypothetical protein
MSVLVNRRISVGTMWDDTDIADVKIDRWMDHRRAHDHRGASAACHGDTNCTTGGNDGETLDSI